MSRGENMDLSMLSRLFLSILVVGLIGIFCVKFAAQLTVGEENADVNETAGILTQTVTDTIGWLPLLALIVVFVVGIGAISYLRYAGVF